ncbi:MAG: hypothetical protein GY820_14015 [Gammaproteobacteria bacterium]|nr:hypothetical protein [Gammaproteobacteria bacterium]
MYDDDHYYMASVVAEQLIADGHEVVLATPAAVVYEGHRFARELGTETAVIPLRRELTELAGEFKLP